MIAEEGGVVMKQATYLSMMQQACAQSPMHS
jgi:hypothetical protein